MLTANIRQETFHYKMIIGMLISGRLWVKSGSWRVKNNSVIKDYLHSRLQPIPPNIIHAIDVVLTQKYIDSIDNTKYKVFM